MERVGLALSLMVLLTGCTAADPTAAAEFTTPAVEQICVPASENLVWRVVSSEPAYNHHSGQGTQVEAFTDQDGTWSVVAAEVSLWNREEGWQTDTGAVPYLVDTSKSSYQPRPVLNLEQGELSPQAQEAVGRATQLAAECLGYESAVTIPSDPPVDSLIFGYKEVPEAVSEWLRGEQAYFGGSYHVLAGLTMTEMRTSEGTWYAVAARYRSSSALPTEEGGYVGWLVDAPPDPAALPVRDALLSREAILDQVWPAGVPAAAVIGLRDAVIGAGPG
ncbi:MAG: hypothetical protein LBJ44_08980 [Propionibacteriaceae bacterium]|jgi:hypothetical protein|nr:hypothetical protein [Propionibacteriaceae bacterium]